MAVIVQKFGGTSVGTIERIKSIAEKIIDTYEKGYAVAVVVSAMSGETNRLIELSKSIVSQPNPREYSVLVSTGEQVSMALLAMYLIDRGYEARSYTGSQAQIITDNNYDKARIIQINCDNIQADLSHGRIVIVAGFQGIDNEGNITTLGRGGSDTTAVALAAALKADECQIYTDVAGVYTADPRVVPEASLLPKITFEEMLEMAALGAKVLQRHSVEFAGKYQVNLRVLSSFEEGNGTLVSFEEYNQKHPLVSGIAFNRNEAKLSVIGLPDKSGIVAHILEPLKKANIDIDMVVQNVGVDGTTDFTFTLSRDEYDKAFEILQKISKQLGAERIVNDQKVAKVSLVGSGMRSHSNIASKMFTILGSEGINIQLISTSEIKVSVIVDEKHLESCVRSLHKGFMLDRQKMGQLSNVLEEKQVQ